MIGVAEVVGNVDGVVELDAEDAMLAWMASMRCDSVAMESIWDSVVARRISSSERDPSKPPKRASMEDEKESSLALNSCCIWVWDTWRDCMDVARPAIILVRFSIGSTGASVVAAEPDMEPRELGGVNAGAQSQLEPPADAGRLNCGNGEDSPRSAEATVLEPKWLRRT